MVRHTAQELLDYLSTSNALFERNYWDIRFNYENGNPTITLVGQED